MLVLYDFKAHPGIVVRTFPETRLVIGSISGTPEPFSVLVVPDIFFYIVPAIDSHIQGMRYFMPCV